MRWLICLLALLPGAAPWCCRACGKCMCKVYGKCPPSPDLSLPEELRHWSTTHVQQFVRSISLGGSRQTCPKQCGAVLALNETLFAARGVDGPALELMFQTFARQENATKAAAAAAAAAADALQADGGGGPNKSKGRGNVSKEPFQTQLRGFASQALQGLLPPSGEQVSLQVLVRLKEAATNRHGGSNNSARRTR